MSGPKVKFKATGLEEYLERLKTVGANIDEVVSQAIQESAKPIEADIKKWAEKHKRTGAVLAGVWTTPISKEGGLIYTEVGISGSSMDENGESEAWHAVFLEYGTPKMKADPGIGPAFRKNKAKVVKIQKEVLEKGGVPVD
jgi:HK97 gp10 family phage protein